MGVGACLYMYRMSRKKFTFAISSPDELVKFKTAAVRHVGLYR